MCVASSAASSVEVNAPTWAALRAWSWVASRTMLAEMLAICGPLRPLTWVAERAPIWVALRTAMPLVWIAPTCVELRVPIP
jgi:hypothetical protein